MSATNPQFSISCHCDDCFDFLGCKLDPLQLISRRRDTSASHDFDEVCSGSDLLPRSFDTIFDSIADSSKVSVRTTTTLFMIVRPLVLSACFKFYQIARNLRECLRDHRSAIVHARIRKAGVQEIHRPRLHLSMHRMHPRNLERL